MPFRRKRENVRNVPAGLDAGSIISTNKPIKSWPDF
jgi:hypothetical protein